MRSRFWPNRILERQSSQNRHAGLKFSRKRENSAPSMKIVQHALFRSCVFLQNRKTVRFPRIFLPNPLFRSCAARLGQIWFFSAKVLKIVKLASNFRQNWKTVRFPWKLYKTLFSGHAQQVFAKSHFIASNFSISWNWPQILFKSGKECAFQVMCISSKQKKQCAFLSVKVLKIVTLAWNSLQIGKTVRLPWKLYKTLFSGHAQHVLAKSHFWATNFQNRHTGLKFSPKLENSALSMKIVQNALFRSCAAGFGQIAFYSVEVFKILKLASNSLQIGKRVRFSGHVHFFKTKKTVRIFERQGS